MRLLGLVIQSILAGGGDTLQAFYVHANTEIT